jgi:hypothetical protein
MSIFDCKAYDKDANLLLASTIGAPDGSAASDLFYKITTRFAERRCMIVPVRFFVVRLVLVNALI